ncbi:cortical actin cytoskeleton protein asp1 [Lentinula edodes]|uniref:Inositol hexakisphosphate and diphosphoinositol-pentakisphosphate kinase n=1 Tax=Lentinula edodes TaxID=5353 RepID=A0A1Q3EDN1_LENED|nr:cortical actin cytoskeleton protein asp1 [Lentinula edodes]
MFMTVASKPQSSITELTTKSMTPGRSLAVLVMVLLQEAQVMPAIDKVTLKGPPMSWVEESSAGVSQDCRTMEVSTKKGGGESSARMLAIVCTQLEDKRPSPRSSSLITRSSSPSSIGSHDAFQEIGPSQPVAPVILGVCAMDVKARSRAMREILIRIVERSRGTIEVKVFGDKVILDEDVENWPRCDILISFFSTDFPLDKAVSYVKLRNPFCINDLIPQALLWDRRLVATVLDHLKVPTPKRVEVSRDGGPKIDDTLRDFMKSKLGIVLGGYKVTPEVALREDGDAIIIDGNVLEKPFVEKPEVVVGAYFASELDPSLNHPRTDGSYIYEQFIDVDNSEDIKVYTVGKDYTHAETRKSPVVDGVVRRNTEGKEIRFITRLTDEERAWASRICEGFGQRVCGYDMLRCDNGHKSQVIDVNGWSFVKGNESYYDRAAEILASLCMQVSSSPSRALPATENTPEEAPTWLLKANVTLVLWKSRRVSVKIDLPGTKAQLKPVYSKKQAGHARSLTKLTLVFKWGGEFTHAARYQSRDLGENMKKDISIMNREVLQNVTIFTSSERRVIASAEIFAAALLDHQQSFSTASSPNSNSSSRSSRSSTDGTTSSPNNNLYCNKNVLTRHNTSAPLQLIIRKDLLDDSNAAKDLMDDVKKRLKILLRPGEPEKRPELTWPKSMKKEPVEVVREVIQLLSTFRDVMRRNYETLDVDKIQERWCCGDEPWLFRERWEKLFEDFCDVEQKKFDPSRSYMTQSNTAPFIIEPSCFLSSMNRQLKTLNSRRIEDYTSFMAALRLFSILLLHRNMVSIQMKSKTIVYICQAYLMLNSREEIGVLTSLPLLQNVVRDLEAARNNGESSLTLYFTKESHIHTLVNLVLTSGLPIANRRIPELDYCSHITFELYERNHGRGKSDKEYSIKLSLSEGAHSSNVLDSTLDARHSLNVQQRRKLTQHLPYSLVIEKLSKHFNRLKDEDVDTGPEYETVEALPNAISVDEI